MSSINFTAPPICGRFMRSSALFRVLAGPVGSGKTVTCIFELLRRACEQEPSPDGIRRTRFAIGRQTLQQLKMTVLKDIQLWLKDISHYKSSESTVTIEFGDVHSELLLIPLEDQEDQRRLLSSQLTGAWLSECTEIDVGLVGPVLGRCGRYPETPTWYGAIADTNMPSEGSEWHRLMEIDRPIDWDIHIQPGGLEPDAENLNYLLQTPETKRLPIDDPRRVAQGRKYYEQLARAGNPDFVKRYVNAQYGDDPSGTAVFRECFKRSFHVVDEVTPVFSHPLIIGQDFGRDPCSIITQVDHRGRLLVLEEVVAEDIGLQLHVNRALRPALAQERYLGRAVAIVGDPAGNQRSSVYEETTFDVLKRMGFSAVAAPTNDIDARLRAVEAFLERQSNGGPAVLIDRQRCPQLIRALDGGYRYGKTRAGQRKPVPDKNLHSHIADAFQYACLSAHTGLNTRIQGRMQRVPTQQRRMPVGAWT